MLKFCNLNNFQQIRNMNLKQTNSFLKITINKFSIKPEILQENVKLTQIYEYQNASQKLRTLYWLHMLYIYGNSALLYFEIFDPTMGYFHGLMLTLSLSLGWASLIVISNIMKRTVYKIYKVNDPLSKSKTLYKFEYLPFLFKSRSDIIDRYDLVEYTMSNLENFHYVRIRSNNYKKVYINTNKNAYEGHEDLHKEFKTVISSGLE
jgi:hypothetical protein